jgi:hypothetical protein
VLGSGQRDFTTAELLDLVSRQWEVFHVVVEQGNHCRMGRRDRVVGLWTDLLGQRALPLADYTKLPEVIVSAIEVNEGRDAATVAGSWSDETALVVRRAVGGLIPRATSRAPGGSSVVRL